MNGLKLVMNQGRYHEGRLLPNVGVVDEPLEVAKALQSLGRRRRDEAGILDNTSTSNPILLFLELSRRDRGPPVLLDASKQASAPNLE